MNQFIKRLVVVGLHGRFDIDISFSDGVNIVFGINGAGKTTLLHLLANAANLDIERFTSLIFQTIKLEIANGPTFELERQVSLQSGHHPQVVLRIDGEHIAVVPDFQERNRRQIQLHREEIRTVLEANSIETTYFPAFRTLGEAWSSFNLSELAHGGVLRRRLLPNRPSLDVPRQWHREARPSSADLDAQIIQTALAREVFGEFVPFIDYPSPRDIQRELDNAIQRAVNRLASDDRSLLSDVFNRVFEAITHGWGDDTDYRTPEEIRDHIGKQLEQLQKTQAEYGIPDSNSAFDALKSQLDSTEILGQEPDDTTTRVLRVYESALSQRDENLKTAFARVRNYIDAVNDFFNGKQLATAPASEYDSTLRLHILHEDGTVSQLEALSSGERQITGLIYSASHIAQGNIILVDEPELSLHIDWQRTIIGAMVQQLPAKQLIVCTHSPIIGAEYDDRMIELVFTPTTSFPIAGEEELEEEDFWDDLDFFGDLE